VARLAGALVRCIVAGFPGVAVRIGSLRGGAGEAGKRRRMPGREAVWIEGGTFLMDSDEFYPEEHPAHRVAVDGRLNAGWQEQRDVTSGSRTRKIGVLQPNMSLLPHLLPIS